MSREMQQQIFYEITTERMRQDNKWGEQNHDPFLYLTVAGEEHGEACEAALELRFGDGTQEHLEQELIEEAACCIAAVECLRRGKWKWGGHHDEGRASENEADQDHARRDRA